MEPRPPRTGPDPAFIERLIKGVMIALVALALAFVAALAVILIVWLYGAVT